VDSLVFEGTFRYDRKAQSVLTGRTNAATVSEKHNNCMEGKRGNETYSTTQVIDEGAGNFEDGHCQPGKSNVSTRPSPAISVFRKRQKKPLYLLVVGKGRERKKKGVN